MYKRQGRGFDRGKEAFGAFKEALEETLSDTRERGDLTTDRARELWNRAVDRARDATSDARDRFDFASRAEYEDLERRIAAIEVLLGVDRSAPPSGSASSEASESPSTTEGRGPAQAPSEPAPDPSTTD